MAKFRITGVWKDSNNVITHYAFHTVYPENKVGRAIKMSKTEAITHLEKQENEATTWIWDYLSSNWKIGENVEVVKGSTEKYLKTNPDDKLKDNLAHLINFGWIIN